MARNVLTVRELGREASWMLVRQALGMPDAKMRSDFMTDLVAVLMFTRRSMPERLCVTAAVRQMGGTTIFEGDQGGVWRSEICEYQKHMLSIMDYYIDCMYIYGFPVTDWHLDGIEVRFPLINAGSPDAHPSHALADIACMLRIKKDLKDVRCAWIGCANGTLYSLVEATAWFPFKLSIALPPEEDASRLRERIAALGTEVVFADSPQAAAKDASFLFAGKKGEGENASGSTWRIDAALMSGAQEDARLLLSASPVRAIPVDVSVLSSRASMLVRQAEYRLRIHKRILHWVFSV